MAGKQIDFWFTMGSTYTYLTAMRLPEIARARNTNFRWRPFHLLTLLKEMNHVPFADKPAKCAYMWRDIERRAEMYGIPARLPAPYPIANSERANLVAIVGMQEGWGIDYVRAGYRFWFQSGQENGSEENIAASLRELGQDSRRVLKVAESDATKAALIAETNCARELGIFGSPSFVVDGELFWGDDRLQDALDWTGKISHGTGMSSAR